MSSFNLTPACAKPKVSIIVVNWNGERVLGDCLESLYRQNYLEREIIVVDNGSKDASVRLVRDNFPEIKLIELGSNRGFAGGNAAGLQCARGDLVALFNNDAWAEEDWLGSLVRSMVIDSKIGVCASKLIIDDTGKINSAGDGVTTAGVGFNRGLGRDRVYYHAPELVFGACGAAVLYRRKMLEEIGFLDEDFFLYDEDTDLNFRAQLAGWKCVYVPGAVVHHKVNATSGRLSDLQVYYHTRNLEFVWIKNMPARLMLRFAHHKVIQEIGAFCYLCVRHMKWAPFFRAKKDALRMLPEMWKKRAEIQRKRRVSHAYLKKLLMPIFSREMVRQKIRQFIQG